MDSEQDSEYDWGAFVVVRANVNGKDKYECIPSSWIVHDKDYDGGYVTKITFKFPSTSKLGKGIKFRKNQPAHKKWPDFIGKMLLDTDSQAEALQFIEDIKAKERKYIKEDGYSSSSSDTSEPDSEEYNPPKRRKTKIKPSQEENKRQNNKNIQVKSKENLDNLESEKMGLHSYCRNFYNEFNASYQKTMSTLDNTAECLLKIISTHKDKVTAKAKLSIHNTTTVNTKWTLRHPEPGPGKTELLPNTGVYVSEKGLHECKIKYITCTLFTRGLVEEVFTDEALSKCSYTGQPPRSYKERDTYQAKPGLDVNARQTLVDYVLKYGGDKGFLYGGTRDNDIEIITQSVRSKLYECYKKSKGQPKRKLN